jgi:hypothetical protein
LGLGLRVTGRRMGEGRARVRVRVRVSCRVQGWVRVAPRTAALGRRRAAPPGRAAFWQHSS